MNNSPAIIWYLAFRPCLKASLSFLYKNFNRHFNYPVIVFSFGPQYSDQFITDVHRNISREIQFIELPPPTIPSHIAESELFYHRKDNPYVKKFFSSAARLGYLHAMYFTAGEFASHPALRDYDWSLRIDDDAFIVKPLPINLFSLLRQYNSRYGDMRVQAQNYPRVLNCQVGLRELAQTFQHQHNIKRPAWDSRCGFGAFTTFDMTIFREPLWHQWWQAIYDHGGIYKHRWGDVEIHSLYLHMRHPQSVIYNYNFEQQGLIKHGGFGVGFVDDQGIYQAHPPLKDHLKQTLSSALKILKK